jgi:DNA adenine methylase
MLGLLEARVPRVSGRYFEPFAGSACLYLRSRPERAVIADLNPDLLSTYRTVRHRPRGVCNYMETWPTDAETYYRVRALDPQELEPIGRAARFIYLNRLCFNGVYRTNRRGQFNVPYGRKTGRLPTYDDFAAFASALRGVDLRTGDFETTTADAGHGDVAYLDPPYTQNPGAAYGVYGYGAFQATDVDRLMTHLNVLDARGVAVVLSYADTPQLRSRLDCRWSLEEVEAYSHVAGQTSARRLRQEVLITNLRARRLKAAE